MLINTSRLINCPVLSLHVGGRVATITEVITDPDTLKLLACRVDGPLVGKETGDILPMTSVREFSRMGMIIDSTDELVEADEIVRIRDVLALNFSLVGLKVETKKGTKLGKVSDSTVDPDSWQIQQLVVQRPLLKSFLNPELVISRRQILEVHDYKVIVKDGEEKVEQRASETEFTPSFINPFREPEFVSEAAELAPDADVATSSDQDSSTDQDSKPSD